MKLPLLRIPSWLLFMLLPIVFLGGFCLPIKPLFLLLEHREIRPFRETDRSYFPVLIRYPGPRYSWAMLADVPDNCEIVTDAFPEAAINRDLQRMNGASSNRIYFRVSGHPANSTSVVLEIPPKAEGKHQGWYDVSNGQILPKQMLSYGVGFVFRIIPFSFAGGFVAVFIFYKLVGSSRKRGVLRGPV